MNFFYESWSHHLSEHLKKNFPEVNVWSISTLLSFQHDCLEWMKFLKFSTSLSEALWSGLRRCHGNSVVTSWMSSLRTILVLSLHSVLAQVIFLRECTSLEVCCALKWTMRKGPHYTGLYPMVKLWMLIFEWWESIRKLLPRAEIV